MEDNIDLLEPYSSIIETCNKSINNDTKNCGDYEECRDGEVKNDGNTGNICCTAYSSCVSSSITIVRSNDSNSGNVVRCDGSYACRNSTVNNNYGNIYFAGRYSGYGDEISTTNDHSILCGGRYSCYQTVILMFKNLYCTGKWSCQGGDVNNSAIYSDINQNVYLYGEESGLNMVINNIQGNVYCGAYRACYSINLSNISGNVYAIGGEVLYGSTIDNIDSNVVAVGYQAMYNSLLTSISTVSFLLFWCFGGFFVVTCILQCQFCCIRFGLL